MMSSGSSAISGTVSYLDNSDGALLQCTTMAVTYEALLQDLIRCCNYTVHQLLSERNELLCKQ